MVANLIVEKYCYEIVLFWSDGDNRGTYMLEIGPRYRYASMIQKTFLVSPLYDINPIYIKENISGNLVVSFILLSFNYNSNKKESIKNQNYEKFSWQQK